MSKEKKVIKEDVVSTIAADTGLKISDVATVVDSLLLNIEWFLSAGKKVQFSGFGSFEPKRRAPRIGRNPHTKEAVPIPARTVPVFVAGKKLKDRVSSGLE